MADRAMRVNSPIKNQTGKAVVVSMERNAKINRLDELQTKLMNSRLGLSPEENRELDQLTKELGFDILSLAS